MSDTDLPAAASDEPAQIVRWWRSWPGQLARVLLAAFPVAWLVTHIDWRSVGAQLSVDTLPYLGLNLVIGLVGFAVGALRWWTLIRGYGATECPSLVRLYRYTLVGMYYAALPTGVAGEVLRGYRLRQQLGGLASSYAVILVDRISGLVGLLLLATVCLPFGPSVEQSAVATALNIGIVVALAMVLLVLGVPYLLHRYPRLAHRLRVIPLIGSQLVQLRPPSSPLYLLGALALSLITQGLAVLAIYCLMVPLVDGVSLQMTIRVVPSIMLLVFIPVTPAGIGQRELVFIYFLGLLLVPQETAVAVSLLAFAGALVIYSVGGLVHLGEKLLGWD